MGKSKSSVNDVAVPDWVYFHLPPNAPANDKVEKKLAKLALSLPKTIVPLRWELVEIDQTAAFESAANKINPIVWAKLDEFVENPELLTGFIAYVSDCFPLEGKTRLIRRFAKHPDPGVRSKVRKIIKETSFYEVSLPSSDDGAWDQTGWIRGTWPTEFNAHPHGEDVRKHYDLPPLKTVGDLIKFFGIKSSQQLGYLLLATDVNRGPYHSFNVPKRGGGERKISAPNSQLRWVQRKILDDILSKVSTHNACHGFVPGRSTVTNAQPHVGSELILKFDLQDFFPTIHYHRVQGLFQSLGYPATKTRFHTSKDSREVAPTLARLCVFASDHTRFGGGVLPQGGPTSPVISNLICRRMDARLTGLAENQGGVYTRYADDLTFSFKEVNFNIGRFRWWVDQVCHQEGFLVNHSKDRTIRKSQRQVVTGIVVNDTMRIPRRDRRRFRAIIHNCQKHGVESQSNGNPAFTSYLQGFASYIYMVHPEEGKAMLESVNALLEDQG